MTRAKSDPPAPDTAPRSLAESAWLEFVIRDHIEPMLEAARNTLSSLDHLRTCGTCLHMFDSADPRGYVNDVARDAYCPACCIEAEPAKARAALAKALETNPEPVAAPEPARLDLQESGVSGQAHVIAAGKSRLMWFDGAGFSLYRERAKTYPSHAAARDTLAKVRKNFKRPNMRVVPAFSARVKG